ncbi:MAG: signal peptide peptidase SppA [Flavobacteriales bacterium]|nr:signal peptide peptidase SppA [Flavobacteriales bacterium]MBK7943666.1 signal peptide peptidase SppA [Flavobacteriales bacterium]MBK9699650.1 signal peptide peptidase SppA [Flavobacteriales bacterium]
MGQFLKYVFASMLGFLLVCVLLFVLLLGIVAAAGASFGDKAPTVKKGSVLHLRLNDQIVDRGRKDDLELDFGPFQGAGRTGLDELLESIDKAGRDERISGIFLEPTMLNTGSATAQEIRRKLMEFRTTSGKPIYAHSEFLTQGTYFLASAADSVFVVPEGDLDFRGLQAQLTFFKGLFDKAGVDIQFIKGSNNRYKSFGESYTETEMTPANEEQLGALIDGIWDQYLEAIAASRHLDKARLDRIADSLEIRQAADAHRLGLVDGVLYRDEVLALMKKRFGVEEGHDLELVTLGTYKRARVKGDDVITGTATAKAKVAVVYATGGISSGKGDEESIGSETLSEAIRTAREDSTVKAIVLRVNSPGGSGLASDVIWREMELARAAKPVVVSMGDVAASGGYYISCNANTIYAEPNTITGSIGVFGIIPNMQELLNEHLGVTVDGVKTNHYADLFDVSRPLRADERTLIQELVDRFYENFKARVAEGRKMTVAQVDSVGRGRVWTGTDAKRVGLVDELGGLEDAITAAAHMAGLESYRTVGYPEQEDLFKSLMKSLNTQASTYVEREVLGLDPDVVRQARELQRVKQATGIQARMPFSIEVH